MLNAPLDILEAAARVTLEPAPIELLGGQAELDDEVVREVFGLNFAPLFVPEPDQSVFILTHDNPGIRASNERLASVTGVSPHLRFHILSGAAVLLIE
jgi:hypothetical protein